MNLPPHVPEQDLVRYVEATNPHEDYSRNALNQIPFSRYDWYGPVVLNPTDPRFGQVHPASARDVRRYERLSTPFPAIIVTLEPGNRLVIHDGAHRVMAARARLETGMPAFIGLLKGTDPIFLAGFRQPVA
jgi:hypothetical protein